MLHLLLISLFPVNQGTHGAKGGVVQILTRSRAQALLFSILLLSLSRSYPSTLLDYTGGWSHAFRVLFRAIAGVVFAAPPLIPCCVVARFFSHDVRLVWCFPCIYLSCVD